MPILLSMDTTIMKGIIFFVLFISSQNAFSLDAKALFMTSCKYAGTEIGDKGNGCTGFILGVVGATDKSARVMAASDYVGGYATSEKIGERINQYQALFMGEYYKCAQVNFIDVVVKSMKYDQNNKKEYLNVGAVEYIHSAIKEYSQNCKKI